MVQRIKLIIIDFHGVMTKGSYKETCRWLEKKYKKGMAILLIIYTNDYLYEVVYHKWFSQAAVGKISERESFAGAVRELGLDESWQELRAKHLSFQKLNKSVFNFCLKLQREGFIILLLSKNTRYQFSYALRKMNIREYFKNIINTLDFGYNKSSPRTIKLIMKKYKVKPQEIIMVDDQDFNLVEPKKLGVHTILYKNFQQMKDDLNNIIRKQNPS